MFICENCGIKINSDHEPNQCPNCSNSDDFKHVGEQSGSLLPLVCTQCETSVLVPDTTGTCPNCGKDSVFVDVAPDTIKPHEGAAVTGEPEGFTQTDEKP